MGHFSQDELDQARDAVSVLELAETYVALKKEGRTRTGPCPICGGDDRFIVWVNEDRWLCRQCPEGENRGDSIDLEMRISGRSFVDVVTERIGGRRNETGRQPERQPTPEQIAATQAREERRCQDKAAATAETARNDNSAAKIIARLRPLVGTPGETYLRDVRRIDTSHWAVRAALESAEAIGWADRVYFNQPDPSEPFHELHARELGAIVAVLTDPVTGERTGGITRTYLHQGLKIGKAMSLGGAGRLGIVRLSPDDEVLEGLHLCEGLESALDAMNRGFAPCWATGSTSQMADFPVLPGIECLTIFADHDENSAGRKAATTAGLRWRAAGREVHVFETPELGDINDIARRTA